MEIGSVCFSLVGVLATIGAKLYCLAQEIEYAESCLDDLLDNVKSTEVQLTTIQEYLARAKLSDTQKSRCEFHLRDTESRTNKFINSIDTIVTKLNDKSLRKVKQKLKLVNGELDGLRYQIDKIDRNLSAIRQELMLGIVLDDRQERQAATAQVIEKLEVIEANTAGTDARRLRKQYKSYAQELMMDDYTMPPTYFPPVSVPTSVPVSVPAQPTALPFWSADSLKSHVQHPDYNGMPELPATVICAAAPSIQQVEKIPWTPPVPQKPKKYSKEAYFDGLIVE
ncbi:hypothetical protein TWF281_003676 [Arthrobotrys megalospora]